MFWSTYDTRDDASVDGELTIEERAELRVKLTGDALKCGVITLLCLLFIPPVGFIMLVCWGWRLGKRFYRLVLEPELRERFVESEVKKQVQATLYREREALQGEHARSLEQLSASIAHEIRNPITAAKSLVQQMEEDPTARENVEYARVALEELRRVERSVSHLLRFARDEEMQVHRVHMADVLDSALETFRDRLSRSGVALNTKFDCDGEIAADAEQLRRVIINLVSNAIDALEVSGTTDPHIDVEMGENLAGTEVWVRVVDNGPGIDPGALEKMWSPFYTSKAAGTGLGLAICRKLVEAHGGRIEVESQLGAGAVFVLTFPKAKAPGTGASESFDAGEAFDPFDEGSQS
jgi:signal transduction histidine kinase